MNDPESRLTRLEESQAFAERTGEQLSEQLRELFGKIERLNRRLESLEARLERSQRADDGPTVDEAGDDPLAFS